MDFKRNGGEPKWDMVKSKIGSPLAELHNRLTEELARRESKESLVPLDRDPVPPGGEIHVGGIGGFAARSLGGVNARGRDAYNSQGSNRRTSGRRLRIGADGRVGPRADTQVRPCNTRCLPRPLRALR